jgi:hypothetical protein
MSVKVGGHVYEHSLALFNLKYLVETESDESVTHAPVRRGVVRRLDLSPGKNTYVILPRGI